MSDVESGAAFRWPASGPWPEVGPAPALALPAGSSAEPRGAGSAGPDDLHPEALDVGADPAADQSSPDAASPHVAAVTSDSERSAGLGDRMALAASRHSQRGAAWRNFTHGITERRRTAAAENPSLGNRALLVGSVAVETVGLFALGAWAYRMSSGVSHLVSEVSIHGDTNAAHGTSVSAGETSLVEHAVAMHDPNTEPTVIELAEWNSDTGEGSIWEYTVDIARHLGYPEITKGQQDALSDYFREYNDLSEGDAKKIDELTLPPLNQVDAKLQELGAEFDITSAEPGTPRNPIVETPAPTDETPPVDAGPDVVVLPPHYETPSLWDRTKESVVDSLLLGVGVVATLVGAAGLVSYLRQRRQGEPVTSVGVVDAGQAEVHPTRDEAETAADGVPPSSATYDARPSGLVPTPVESTPAPANAATPPPKSDWGPSHG